MDSVKARAMVNDVSATPPGSVEHGLDRLFQDHESLSDFIFELRGIKAKHDDLREMARRGEVGPNDETSIWMLRYLTALEAEVHELKESIAWKWWRSDKTNVQNVRVEIVDIFHFLISMSVVAGMDGRDFARVYYEKRKLNFDRQIVGFRPDDNAQIGASIGVPRPADGGA